jgi:hypothetical protein
VEAQQCVELTSTNRPFGLIIKLSQCVESRKRSSMVEFADYVCSSVRLKKQPNLYASQISLSARQFCALRVSGGHIARVTPVPIPNTVVKPR